MNILVIGIGQSMRGDDAAGLEVVQAWRMKFPGTAAGVDVEFAELPGLGLLDMVEGRDAVILVDAVQSAEPAGTIILLKPEDLASFGSDSGSAHGWGVAETLQLGQSLYPWLADCRITLIGIVGRQFDVNAGLSPEVRKALPEAAERLEAEVNGLL
jgi:hydrogenase maturation protease